MADQYPKPLIVCGMGRAGTRMITDILVQRKDINMYGEIPPQMIADFFKFMETVDKGYLTNAYDEFYSDKRLDFIQQSFRFLSKGFFRPIDSKCELRYFGYKSPRHERFYKELDCLFFRQGLKPVYIYCCRDAVSNWASYKNMTWNKFNVRQFLEDYCESFRVFNKMLRELSDRCIVFNLNEYIRSSDQNSYVSKILSSLELDQNIHTLDVNRVKNRNATARFTKSERRATPAEIEYILNHDEYRKIALRMGWT
jgi:hypothetical protein